MRWHILRAANKAVSGANGSDANKADPDELSMTQELIAHVWRRGHANATRWSRRSSIGSCPTSLRSFYNSFKEVDYHGHGRCRVFAEVDLQHQIQ
jgi:hypothetical protein